MPEYEVRAYVTISAASKKRAVRLANHVSESFDAICRIAGEDDETVTFSTEGTGADLGIEEA